MGYRQVMLNRKLANMFLISSRTVKRWAESWEMTGEEAIVDQRSQTMHNEVFFFAQRLF